MACFIKFLNLAGLLEGWIADCPLTYRAPTPDQARPAEHLAAVDPGRAQAVRPRDLDPQRRADPQPFGGAEGRQRGRAAAWPGQDSRRRGVAWLREHLERSVLPLLKAPLDLGRGHHG